MTGQEKNNSAAHVATIRAAILSLESPQGTYKQKRAKLQAALHACDSILNDFNEEAAPDCKTLLTPFNAASHYATVQREVSSYERPAGRFLDNDMQRLGGYMTEARVHLADVERGLQGAFLSPILKDIDLAFALKDELTHKRMHVELLASTLRCADTRTAYVAYGVTGKADHTPKF